MQTSTTPSNSDFLAALAGPAADAPDSRFWVTSIQGDPNKETRGWGGRLATATEADKLDSKHNTYYSVALFPKDAKNRRIDTTRGIFVVVLDDVGEEGRPLPSLPPTYRLETSTGSEQWGYALAALATPAELRPLLRQLGKDGLLGDQSGNGPVRYVRLPVGTNTKYDPPFPHALREWQPERRFSLKELEAAFGVQSTQNRGPSTTHDDSEPVNRDELLDALAHIDPDCSYDEWLKIGMALHRAFDGNEQGLRAFDEWSAKGKKYEAGGCEQKWTSFHPAEGGVTPSTIFFLARKAGWTPPADNRAQAELATALHVAELNPSDANIKAACAALADPGVDALDKARGIQTLADLAGISKTVIEKQVRAARANKPQASYKPGTIYPLSQPLPKNAFPFTSTDPLGNTTVLRHEDNYAVLLDAYGFDFHYDQIRKRIVWSHPAYPTITDNRDEALFSILSGLCALNGISDSTLGTALIAIADRRQVNPVVDYLKGLKWDGTARIASLTALWGVDNPEAVGKLMRRWFIHAVAAADNGETGCALNGKAKRAFEYVLVLLGQQGAQKTKGVATLLPPALLPYFGDSKLLDLASKDSQLDVLSYWLVEIGELDATFRRSDVVALKAFLSRTEDVLRAPYARTASRFVRRTAFLATVNDESFLRDQTGNRRYIVVPVAARITNPFDPEQLWAEAWAAYTSGEQFWPDEEEERVAAEAAADHTTETAWMEWLREVYDWSQPLTVPRKTAREIHADLEVEFVRLPRLDNKSLQQLTEAIRTLQRGKEVEGGARRYAANGKGRGYAMPPILTSAVSENPNIVPIRKAIPLKTLVG